MILVSSLKRFLLVWVGIIVLILIGAMFIVTDSKRVHRVLQACEKAVRASDRDGFMSQIAPGYNYQGLDWNTLHDLAGAIFQRNRFSTTFIRSKSIKIDGDVANVTFAAFVQTDQGSAIPGGFNTRWRLKMQKKDRKWSITEIEFLSLNGTPVGPLREMMEQAAGAGGGY